MGLCCSQLDSDTVKFTSYAERKIQFRLLRFGKILISDYLQISDLDAGNSFYVPHSKIHNLGLATKFDIIASIALDGLSIKLKLDPSTILSCYKIKFGYEKPPGGPHYFVACLCREKSDDTDWVMATTNDGIRYSFYTRTNLGPWKESDEVPALQALQDVQTPNERLTAPSMPPEVIFLDTGTSSTTSPGQHSTIVTSEASGSRPTTNPYSRSTKHEHNVPFQRGLWKISNKVAASQALQDVQTCKERSGHVSLYPLGTELTTLDSTTSPGQPLSTVVASEAGGSRATGPTNPGSRSTKLERRFPLQVAALAGTMEKLTSSDVLVEMGSSALRMSTERTSVPFGF